MAPPEPTPPGSIAGIVLAAGAAERMGEAKQLLPYRGLPILQHVVDAAEASRLHRVIVVTGAHADEVEAALHLAKAMTVRNPDFERGNMSSLECGAAQVPEAEAIVLLMGDHPDVDAGVIDRMVALWRDEHPWGAVTEYSDRVGHPFLLSRAALDEAVDIGGRKLLWRLLGDDRTGRVTRLRVNGAVPIDVNTAADYERLLGQAGQPTDQ